MVWTLVVLASLTLSGYFLFTNLEDYRDDTTIVSLYDPQVLQESWRKNTYPYVNFISGGFG